MDDPSSERWCADCKSYRGVLEFSYKYAQRGVFQSYCKPCQRQRSREHYQRNADAHKARVANNNRRMRATNRARLHEYLSLQSCADCGLRDLAALEFDHRDPHQKRMDVSGLTGNASSWKAVLAEVQKCDVVCANCHRKRTAVQFGWHKTAEPRPPALPPLPRRGTADYERIKSQRSCLARRYRNRSIVWHYLMQHPCVLCGEADPVVLDFDHIAEKYRDLGWLIPASCQAKIIAEIGKCRVLCANCHRRHTAAQRASPR